MSSNESGDGRRWRSFQFTFCTKSVREVCVLIRGREESYGSQLLLNSGQEFLGSVFACIEFNTLLILDSIHIVSSDSVGPHRTLCGRSRSIAVNLITS